VFYQNQSKRTSRFHFFLPPFLKKMIYPFFCILLAFLSFSLSKIKQWKQGQFFDLEFKTSDLLTILNWKKNQRNLSKIQHFFFRWKDKPFSFQDTPHDRNSKLFNTFIFNKNKGIFKVSFNTDFLRSIFSFNLTVKQHFWKHWGKVNATYTLKLPNSFVLALLAMLFTQGSYQSFQTLFNPFFFSVFLFFF
jgi:hypothetical protein